MEVAYSTSICLMMEMQWVNSGSFHSGEFFHGPFEIVDKDVPFILLMNDGKTRPVDARALTFLHRFDALTTVVDAKDYGLGNAVDSSVITYFNPLMHTAVFRVYAEELSYVRQHPLMAYREYRKVRPTPYGKLTDPQAEPLMNALRSRGLKVAVASSSAAPDIMKMLTEGGLKAMVDFAFSGEDCAAHKPAPDIYLKALKALGLTADKAIAVEDSPTGIASAKAAGLKVLALKPRHGEPLDQSAADCIITQLMDVKEHLD